MRQSMAISERVVPGIRSLSLASPPSSPAAAAEAEKLVNINSKSICFWGYDCEKEEANWYVFEVDDNCDGFIRNNDLKNEIAKKARGMPEGIELVPRHFHNGENKFGRGVLAPVYSSVMDDRDIERGSCVAMGTVIYRCGSRHCKKPHHNGVLCFDLQCPESGWRCLPPMINPRCQSNAVALDGKLYVMGGGLGNRPPWPWGEVYDPCLEKWEPLPLQPWQSSSFPPPKYPPDQIGATVDASEKKILVNSFQSSRASPYKQHVNVLYSYDASINSWEVTDGAVQLHYCGTGAAVVDRTVYWLSCGRLKAFDLERKVSSMCCIDGLEEEYVMQERNNGEGDPTLLHLDGDKFCIFWVAKNWLHGTIHSHCVKIRISKSSDAIVEGGHVEFKLNAFVESCQSYTLHQEIEFFDALVVE